MRGVTASSSQVAMKASCATRSVSSKVHPGRKSRPRSASCNQPSGNTPLARVRRWDLVRRRGLEAARRPLRRAGLASTGATGAAATSGTGWLTQAICRTSSIHFTGLMLRLPLMLSGISAQVLHVLIGDEDGLDTPAMRGQQLFLSVRRSAALRRAA